MKTALSTLSILAVVAMMAAPLAAEDKLLLPDQSQQFHIQCQKLKFSDKQQTQYQQIYKQHQPILQKHYQTQQKIYTQDQWKQHTVAVQKADKDGLVGKKRQQYIQSAVQFTPEQQKQYTQCQTEITKCHNKYYDEVVQILTPQQQELIPKHFKVGKKGKGKPAPK